MPSPTYTTNMGHLSTTRVHLFRLFARFSFWPLLFNSDRARFSTSVQRTHKSPPAPGMILTQPTKPGKHRLTGLPVSRRPVPLVSQRMKRPRNILAVSNVMFWTQHLRVIRRVLVWQLFRGNERPGSSFRLGWTLQAAAYNTTDTARQQTGPHTGHV
jgi:hypothetical protein